MLPLIQVAYFMPECQSFPFRLLRKKHIRWPGLLRNRWPTLLRNHWPTLLRNEWPTLVQNHWQTLVQNSHTVTIHTIDGTVKLKTVHKLEITNKAVSIHTEGTSKIAYTKKSDNDTLEPFSVFGLNNVVLDHEKPLVRIMQENSDNLPTFREITVQLKKHIGRKITRKKVKKAANILLKSDYIDMINIENLKSEMAFISGLTHLQLMDESENKRKGASH
ncbi:MAG: hypothetical protein NTW16_02770 [Bacteroidetes bacterium]|nr:hypothetical protein [Bacteroidota bacterium]